MNILTFDIEEWSVEKEFGLDRNEKYYEYDCILDNILGHLNDHKIKATFFCVGKMADDFPYVINKILKEGHEIGCHSYSHKWVNKMTREEFEEDTKRAVGCLEDLTGEKIKSYRAPAFSIGKNNLWAFEVLVANGIENDSSIYPDSRDFGGFADFKSEVPCVIEYGGSKIKEFPIPLFHIPLLDKKMAFSGGGYFRLLPYPLINNLVRKGEYNMSYFHIKDLLVEKTKFLSRKDYEYYFKEDGSIKRRLSRYFKSNVGRRSALKKLFRLLEEFDFNAIESYKNDYCKRPLICL